jgi:hypothetical protein
MAPYFFDPPGLAVPPLLLVVLPGFVPSAWPERLLPVPPTPLPLFEEPDEAVVVPEPLLAVEPLPLLAEEPLLAVEPPPELFGLAVPPLLLVVLPGFVPSAWPERLLPVPPTPLPLFPAEVVPAEATEPLPELEPEEPLLAVEPELEPDDVLLPLLPVELLPEPDEEPLPADEPLPLPDDEPFVTEPADPGPPDGAPW